VQRPGTYEILEPNYTVLQALGVAGDLSIRGNRNTVLIIRTVNDKRVVRRIDLTKSDWMNSPYYFIKQNDVIYVEPNTPQVKTAGYIGDVATVLSIISIMLTTYLIFLN
jgi:polysaccharide export outer membrane protein